MTSREPAVKAELLVPVIASQLSVIDSQRRGADEPRQIDLAEPTLDAVYYPPGSE
jgi:hypothetical protein